MTSGTPSSDGPKGVARDHKAEIVDRLYDVALDPIRLEELMQVWEGRIGILRQGHVKDVVPLDDPEIEAHLDRASIFLDRFVASREDGAYRSVLEDIPRSAAFLSDGGPILTGFNRPAAVAFGLMRALGHDRAAAATIAASLAQIGEFSFILIVMGVDLSIVAPEARDMVVAGALVSILVNPLLFRLLDRKTQAA